MGVCSAKQKDPTQPGAPLPQPKFETPVKPSQSNQPSESVTIHFPDNSSPPKPATAPSSPASPGSPERETTENDLLADLRNQPSLEAAEAEERKRKEEVARLEQIRREAEQAQLRAEEERRVQAEERKQQEAAAAKKAAEEEAERQRLATEEAKIAEAQAVAEAKRKQEEERARAQAFVEEARAASRAEAQRQAEAEERAKEELAKREADERAEALRVEEEARQRAEEEAETLKRQEEETKRAEEERVAQEIAAKKAKEDAEEAEKLEAENKLTQAIAERKKEVKSRVEDLQQRTGVKKVEGLIDHSLFFCELLWLEDFTGMKFQPELTNFKSGQVLCAAVNIVQPKSANFSDSPSPWKQRENILAFLNACEGLGLKKEALFLPQDLLEGQNMNNVVKTLDVFYKIVNKREDFKGPPMPSPDDAADENEKRSSVSLPQANNRTPTGKKPEYGMHADMRQKQTQKLQKEAPNIEKVSEWVKKLSGVEFKDFQEGLKSGVVLCKTMNKIKKGSIKKINNGEKPFQQRENIKNFIEACKELGLKDQELFEPSDLYEGKDLLAVAESLISLSRLLRGGKVAEFVGPYIPELDKARTPAAWANTLSDGKIPD